VHITAQGPRLRNDLYCVEWDVKLYYTIPYLLSRGATQRASALEVWLT